MAETQQRYWASRIDKDNTALLWNELQVGRLRQGWGYDPSQDLRLIDAETRKGGDWWNRRTVPQDQAARHMRLLASTHDAVQKGDWILVPNVPSFGSFVIAEVSGDYDYQMLALSADQDVNELGTDYGHVLPVRLLTPQGVNKFAECVHAGIRQTLKCRGRMWNLDSHGDALAQIVEAQRAGNDLSTAHTGTARLQSAWEKAFDHAADELRGRLEPELRQRFTAAEWEEPLSIAMRHLYPGAEVDWVAGAHERGADLILTLPNHMGSRDWIFPVQVKDHSYETGPAVLEQLREAYTAYQERGQIIGLAVATTAEASELLIERAKELQDELGIPVEIIARKKLIDLLVEGLLKRAASTLPNALEQ